MNIKDGNENRISKEWRTKIKKAGYAMVEIELD